MPDKDPYRTLINPFTGQPVLSAEEVAALPAIIEEQKARKKKREEAEEKRCEPRMGKD